MIRIAILCGLLLTLGRYQADSDVLGGADRFLTHVSTDKPIYRVGETVHVRAVVLQARTRAPLPGGVYATIEVKGPKGETVATGGVSGQDAALGFGWPVPEGVAGGEYTAVVHVPQLGLAPATRKFDVRVFRAPRLKSQILFARDGYGPGDTATANLHTERAEGGIPRGATVRVSARVDDVEVYAGTTKVDASGNASASFPLPAVIAVGEGSVAMTIEDGGVVETASKTIPILLQTLDLQMYPEGGDLVAKLPARLYIEARTPAKKPADIEAAIVDRDGRAVATLTTEHEGRGRVSFTPDAGQSYALKILAPSGITRSFPLPAVKENGAIINAVGDVIPRGGKARFLVTASEPGDYVVRLSQREVELASKTFKVAKGGWFSGGKAPGRLQELALSLPAEADGVLIATLWNDAGEPLAERLVFRAPARRLQIKIKPDRQNYVPGGRASLEVTTTDETGKPVSAVVGLAVTDESVLEMIDKREQAPRLPVMVFLEPEVRELADAHVYLDPDNAKAPLATDLLLGTQGWRRFALKDIPGFVATAGDAARSALAIQLPPPPPVRAPRRARGGQRGEGMAVPMAAPDMDDMPAAAAPEMDEAAPAMAPAAAKPMARPEPRPGRPAASPSRVAPADMGMEPPRAPGRQQVQPPEEAKRKAVAKREIAEAARSRAVKDRDARLIAQEQTPAHNVGYVREYAHQVRANRQPTDRVDFAETLYWHAGLRTDVEGKAKVSFGLSDAVTSFLVAADAYGDSGELGSTTRKLQSLQPFYLEPKVPLQLTMGDIVELPVALVNGTFGDLLVRELSLAATKGIAVTPPAAQPSLPAGARVRTLFRVDTGSYAGKAELVVSASAGELADQVTRPLDVQPRGFPATIAFGGMLEPDATQTMTIEMPADVVAGSLVTELVAYPAPLGNLTQALTRLMREPNGCFEQTSSTSYPLTMAQQYFTTHQGVDPELVQRSGEILQRGYRRLTSFECKEKGYEWFGGAAPGHEALTAYGLMQFADMRKAKLSLIDHQMVERTRAWLLARRDGKGGFERNARALDSFGGAPLETTNAYIVWALLEAGEKGLEREIATVAQAAAASSDSYVIALGARVGWLSGDKKSAQALMAKLAAKQDATGAVQGAATSITRSGGEALTIETTALSMLAWLADPARAGECEKAMKYLSSTCEGGRFSSTQATVLALKAIVAYDATRSKVRTGGSVQVLVDGKPAGDVTYGAEAQGALSLPSIAGQLTAGKHQIELRAQRGVKMPYSLSARYHALTPVSSDKSKLTLVTSLAAAQVVEGKIAEVRVEVANASDSDAPTPVAIVGVPGGLEVRHDQLKELVKSGTIAAYEVLGREVVLYWRQLKAKQKVTLPLSCVAAIPGRFTAPASRVYEYYTDEHKRWVPGLSVVVTPLAGR